MTTIAELIEILMLEEDKTVPAYGTVAVRYKDYDAVLWQRYGEPIEELEQQEYEHPI